MMALLVKSKKSEGLFLPYLPVVWEGLADVQLRGPQGTWYIRDASVYNGYD